jgi:hypothetical protein
MAKDKGEEALPENAFGEIEHRCWSAAAGAIRRCNH